MNKPSYLRRMLPLVAGLLLAAASAYAESIKIIANSSVPVDAISARELKSVFLAENNRLRGVHVEPVLEKGGQAHEVFLKQYMGQSDSELQTYYRTLVVTGRGVMPKALGSDADVVSYVSQTRGAIGYVSASTATSGVKILMVGEDNSGPERKLLTRVEPDYPEALQKRSIGGVVRLQLMIAANGDVEKAQLLGGNPVLADAAMAAVFKWKYSPAPSRTTAEVSISFHP